MNNDTITQFTASATTVLVLLQCCYYDFMAIHAVLSVKHRMFLTLSTRWYAIV